MLIDEPHGFISKANARPVSSVVEDEWRKQGEKLNCSLSDPELGQLEVSKWEFRC